MVASLENKALRNLDLNLPGFIEEFPSWEVFCCGRLGEVVGFEHDTLHRLLDILEACLWQQGWCDTETYCLLFKQKPSILLKIGKFVRPDS